jgi:hypothetical protein
LACRFWAHESHLRSQWLHKNRNPVESRRGAVATGSGSRCFPTWCGVPHSDATLRSAAKHESIAPSPRPAHRTGRADFPHPALGQGIMRSPTGALACSAVCSFRTVRGVVRFTPISRSCATSCACLELRPPSLHPALRGASTVLRASPPPHPARLRPSRAAGWWSRTTTGWGFPCCVRSPCTRMPSPLPRWGRRAPSLTLPDDASLP